MSTNPLYHKDMISIADLEQTDLFSVLALAKKIQTGTLSTKPLMGKVIAICFYEASTRTRLSFESAVLRLGGQVIGFSDAAHTSTKKGESLVDTIRVIGEYADAIIIRHPLEGAARLAAQATGVPVINAGDGANKHPTQTLLDLFSIEACQGRLTDLNIGFIGDLKHSRTVHSLTSACARFDNRLYFISPKQLMLPDEYCENLIQNGIKYSFHHDVQEIIPKLDILYVTRLQKERFIDPYHDIGRVHQQPYQVTLDMLDQAKSNLRILHPLPRVDELERAIDDTPYSYYFQQAANGLAVRQALLTFILSETAHTLIAESE